MKPYHADWLKRELKRMIELRVIQKSKSLYTSNIVIVEVENYQNMTV